MEPLIKTGLTHLYFVTIHPFKDVNGRIARAITEVSLGSTIALRSSQIREERKDFCAILESTTKRRKELKEWLIWFFACLARPADKANGEGT